MILEALPFNLSVLDWIIIAIIALGVVFGFMKGAVKQAATIVGLIAGLLLARALFSQLGEKLAVELGTTVSMAQVIAFFMIWILVPVVFLILAYMLTKALEIVHLGIVNRLLGALLGALKYAFIVSLAISFLEYIDSKDELINRTVKQSSLLYYPVKELSGLFIPTLKNVTNEIIQTDII
ncbi:CvpA family protein [Bacteroides caecigallinarum]|uniref:CvpA family protein n=1 Tax=Bacteroides caecigallinarum TaxID=1411144 RepID=UPI00195D83E7|nr:CvpA family protein [Bacteroides caecigallinarum]MBM6961123.1 CvpA family protein [Bacteroides caecigallinarum]